MTNINPLKILIHEQLKEYGTKLREVEKEIIRKYKMGENHSDDLIKVNGLKLMQKTALQMLKEQK